MTMPRYWLGVAFVVCAGSSALARTPRYSRPEIQVPVQLTDRVKPALPAHGAKAQPAIATADVLSPDLARPARPDQERVLEQLVQHTPDTVVEEKADYLFRLGDHYARQARWFRTSGDASRAKTYLLRTVTTFKALTDNQAFRAYPKMDVALFLYGYTLQGGKYMKEARAVYDHLLKHYPASTYVPQAHLAFADYYFDAGQLADAEVRYRMVLKFPKSAIYHYATYKLGWVNFQLARFQEALELFFQVAIAARTNTALEPLARASRLDFVRAYAEIGRPERASLAFERVDRAAVLEMLEHLAYRYAESGRGDKARETFRKLVAIAPKDPRICTWQYKLVHAGMSSSGTTTDDKVKAIEELVAVYRRLAATHRPDELGDCKANALAMSGELARAYHNESLKTRNHDTLGYALRLYRANVDTFPNEPSSPDTRYYLAEALWSSAVVSRNDRDQRELFEHAAVAFGDVARTDRARARIAAYASVLAWLNALESLPQAAPELTRGRPAPATPLATNARHLVEAIQTYAREINSAHDLELGQFRMIEARLYRAHSQHDKAAPIFVALHGTHPTADFAEAAAIYAIDTLVILQRLDEMLAFADRVAADARFLTDKPELARVIQLVRSRSMRR
jgi:tetratricopeptide (TPR) repeat protein